MFYVAYVIGSAEMEFKTGERDVNRFEGKVALVSGAASGIGRETAKRFAAEGAKVMMADMNANGLVETAAMITSETGQVVFDAADRSQCLNIVSETIKQFGQLDVLCNIAGFAMSKHFTDVTPEQWSKMVDVNLNSVFHVSQAAMPHLLETKGNIVNMASSAGLGGQAYNSAYCATKGAVVMLSKALAVEYAGRGVRVNAVCPGGVATPLTDKFEAPEDADMSLMARLFPLMDMAQPEEIAGAVAYLASPEARFVTGDAFAIDGGQVAS